MIKTQSAGGIILNKKDRVVLVKERGSKHWGFPKGHVEDGENILDAALREIYEETSLKQLNLIKKLGSYKRFDSQKTEFKTIHIYLFNCNEDDPNPQWSDVVDSKWFLKNDVISNLSHEEDRQFFKSIINEI